MTQIYTQRGTIAGLRKPGLWPGSSLSRTGQDRAWPAEEGMGSLGSGHPVWAEGAAPQAWNEGQKARP